MASVRGQKGTLLNNKLTITAHLTHNSETVMLSEWQHSNDFHADNALPSMSAVYMPLPPPGFPLYAQLRLKGCSLTLKGCIFSRAPLCMLS